MRQISADSLYKIYAHLVRFASSMHHTRQKSIIPKKNREKAESSSFFPNSLPTFAIQKGNN